MYALTLPLLLLILVTGCQRKTDGLVGSTAPDFSLNDITGKHVSLSAMRGRVVLLEFWATWCPPCLMAVQHLKSLHEKYNSRGFTVLAIAVDGEITAVKEFAAEKMLPYPVLFDDKDANGIYGVRGIPAAFLIDKQGIVQSTHNGYTPDMAVELSEKIESLL
ncbi:MAG: TlpA disulfide reductase family protein [Thermodesulfovibrionales bacterium]|nr:TlpA disulfide reductase family protein [Thermodesulfovibrionales bacterium]